MMLVKRFVLLLLLTGCARPEVCDRIEGRLAAAKEFCQGVSMNLARSQCGGTASPDSQEFAQCIDLMLIKGMEACVPMSGSERLAWALSEFCSE